MKYVKQLAVILFISFLGELLNALLPFPIPASIYGMVILFVGLLTRIIRLEWVKEAGLFLVEIMPVFFIPVCVGLMDSWVDIAPFWFPLVVIVCLTTVIVMVVTGRTAQSILRRNKTEKKEERHE
ncbi:MAG: CidA/LrgA family protein [Lachnospiraceae bacterium]|nr:CidA/LrgA family protein [Lachnospiraceae bacterium]